MLIKAAVIGAGYLGRFHAEKYARSEHAELVAVVDTDEKRANDVANPLGCKALTDYRKLSELGVNCASVASNTPTHYEISKWLLENGIDVLVEKPMTVSVREAQSLIAIAKEKGRILQVGHLERFNPAFRAMKNMLTRPLFFEVRRIAPYKPRGVEVDVVLDLMIHDIDIVSHLVGSPVRHVEATGVPVLTDTVDIASSRVTFENGAVANFTASRAAFKSERTMRVFQPNVYVSLDYGNKSLKIYSKSPATNADGLPEISIVEHNIDAADALQDEINSFVKSVEYRTAPEVSGEDGLRALELVQRIHDAFERSRMLIESAVGRVDVSSVSSAETVTIPPQLSGDPLRASGVR